MTWVARHLRFAYAGAPIRAVDDVSLVTAPGTLTAIIGPNGAGKSTLLRLLLGTLVPQSGTVAFAERPLGDWSRPELARAIGVLPQGEEPAFPLRVRDLVAMGRYPHLGPWRSEGDEDRAAIAKALSETDTLRFAERPFGTLSGGERQRVRLARALAQTPAALALDEPTTSLDVSHEMQIFELLRLFVANGGTGLLVTHNLNLAARYAQQLVLMACGQCVAAGTPAHVLTADRISTVYGWPVQVEPHQGAGHDAGVPQVIPLSGAR
jgi:iron complex transport system ATP-binding protein